MNGLLIIGAGGHGRVVADTAYEAGRWGKIAFLDDRFPTITSVFDWPVLGKIDSAGDYLDEYQELLVGIGDNKLRIDLLQRFNKLGFAHPVLIHPSASVSKRACLEQGTVVFAQAAINTGVKVGIGGIINTGATVDHDCELGKGVHISPGVYLAGNVKVGNYSWFGISSTAINQVSIGKNVTVGAGSVVIGDIPSNVTVVGVPAKIIKKDPLQESGGPLSSGGWS